MKYYCMVANARQVRGEQLAQGHYTTVARARFEPATLRCVASILPLQLKLLVLI